MDEKNRRDTNNQMDDIPETEEEEYQFLNETYKRPPIKKRTVLTGVAMIIVCAVLFGVIAAVVFLSIIREHEENVVSTVSLTEDEDELSEVTPTPTPTVVPSQDQAVDAPKDRSEMTADELRAEALENYDLLNQKMKAIGLRAERYLVHITGIRSREDWLNHTDISTTTQSGLIVADNGQNLLILIDYASIDGAEQIAVTFPDGTILDGSFLKRDPITNLAIIGVSHALITDEVKRSYSIANLGNSYRISTGDSVIAIGSPLGYSGSIGYGEVTSTENTISVIDGEYNLITTTIQGSSTGNGLLINTDGEVIGLIFQRYAIQNNASIVGVPISLLKHLIEVLSNNGTLTYAGFKGQTITHNVAESSGMPEGVYVTSVEADSPALAAGLAVGDIIEEIDGLDTSSMKLLHTKLGTLKVGDIVEVTVRRLGADGYKKFKFKLTVGEVK